MRLCEIHASDGGNHLGHGQELSPLLIVFDDLELRQGLQPTIKIIRAFPGNIHWLIWLFSKISFLEIFEGQHPRHNKNTNQSDNIHGPTRIDVHSIREVIIKNWGRLLNGVRTCLIRDQASAAASQESLFITSS